MICPRCKQNTPILTKDHVFPAVLGKICQRYGITIEINWQSAENIENVCPNCNFSKGHKTITPYAKEVVEKILSDNLQGFIYIKSTDLRVLKEMNH
jgi:hypothetical protein